MKHRTILALILLPFLIVHVCYSQEQTEQKARDQRSEILISNPGNLVHAEFIDNQATNLWRTLSYEAEGFSGVMIAEGGGPGIPPARIPLNITGRYKIHLGLFSGYYTRPKIMVKLSRDKDYQELSLLQTLSDRVRDHQDRRPVAPARSPEAEKRLP